MFGAGINKALFQIFKILIALCRRRSAVYLLILLSCLGRLFNDIISFNGSALLSKLLKLYVELNWVCDCCCSCKECSLFSNRMFEAATVLKNSKPNAILADIDCSVSTMVCREYNVRTYPVLIGFRRGDIAFTYNGEKTSTGIVQFMQSQPDTCITVLESLMEFSDYMVHTDSGIFGFFDEGITEELILFEKSAVLLCDSYNFAMIRSDKVLQNYGFINAVTFFESRRSADEVQPSFVKYNGQMNVENIMQWIKSITLQSYTENVESGRLKLSSSKNMDSDGHTLAGLSLVKAEEHQLMEDLIHLQTKTEEKRRQIAIITAEFIEKMHDVLGDDLVGSSEKDKLGMEDILFQLKEGKLNLALQVDKYFSIKINGKQIISGSLFSKTGEPYLAASGWGQVIVDCSMFTANTQKNEFPNPTKKFEMTIQQRPFGFKGKMHRSSDLDYVLQNDPHTVTVKIEASTKDLTKALHLMCNFPIVDNTTRTRNDSKQKIGWIRSTWNVVRNGLIFSTSSMAGSAITVYGTPSIIWIMGFKQGGIQGGTIASWLQGFAMLANIVAAFQGVGTNGFSNVARRGLAVGGALSGLVLCLVLV